MQPSQKCIDLIKDCEGFRSEAYQDSAGIWTIGIGTIKYPNGIPVKQHDQCTLQQAEEWLMHELQSASHSVNNLIFNIPINQNQFDALVSFVYNLGAFALSNSTLYRKARQNPNDETIYKYNPQDLPRSCEFLKWITVKGITIKGLVNRRKKEADLYAE